MKKITKIFGSMGLAIFPLIIGCGGSGGADSDSPAVSEIRVIHLSPNAPSVDVHVDNGPVLQGISFPTASEYLPIDSGTKNIKVNIAGSKVTAINADVTFNPNTRYSVIAVNTAREIEALVLVDQAHSTGGNAAVRVVHGAPGAPNVDVYVTAPGEDLNGAEPTLKNVPFKTASGYLSLPPGDYQFRATPTGSKAVAIDSGTVTLTADQVFTALARDNLGGGAPFSLLLAKDNL